MSIAAAQHVHGPVRSRRWRSLAAAAATATALPLLTVSSASASTGLHISSTVAIGGTLTSSSSYQAISAEGPNGTVYVATKTHGLQTVWVAGRTGPARPFRTITGQGVITALASDAAYLYVGTPRSISSYKRSTGALVRRWPLSSYPRSLSQVIVAGNRVWGLLTPLGYARKPSSMVEINPAATGRVRTLNGVPDTFSLAADSSGVYYVTNRSSQIIHLSNGGIMTTAKTHLAVDQQLAGPAAVQALLVAGKSVVVRFDAGQGTDAGTYAYKTSTLAGPGNRAKFNASSTLGNTRLGLLEVSNGPEGDECPASTTQQCLHRYGVGSGGAFGPALNIPYALSGTPMGPYPALVVVSGSKLHLLRVS